MNRTERFEQLVNYLNYKGCKFLVKEDYVNNTKSIVGATWYKKGKFYRVNNVVVAQNMLPIINEFINLR